MITTIKTTAHAILQCVLECINEATIFVAMILGIYLGVMFGNFCEPFAVWLAHSAPVLMILLLVILIVPTFVLEILMEPILVFGHAIPPVYHILGLVLHLFAFLLFALPSFAIVLLYYVIIA